MSSSRMGAMFYQASPKLLVFADWPFDSQARGSMMARRKGQDCTCEYKIGLQVSSRSSEVGKLTITRGREWHRRMMKGR